jgi:hypothetical protein
LFAGPFTLWVSNENRHSGAGRNPGNGAESGGPILDPGLRRGDRTAVFRIKIFPEKRMISFSVLFIANRAEAASLQ